MPDCAQGANAGSPVVVSHVSPLFFRRYCYFAFVSRSLFQLAGYAAILSVRPMSSLAIKLAISSRISIRSSTVPRPSR
jgi:hypothetical protein